MSLTNFQINKAFLERWFWITVLIFSLFPINLTYAAKNIIETKIGEVPLRIPVISGFEIPSSEVAEQMKMFLPPTQEVLVILIPKGIDLESKYISYSMVSTLKAFWNKEINQMRFLSLRESTKHDFLKNFPKQVEKGKGGLKDQSKRISDLLGTVTELRLGESKPVAWFYEDSESFGMSVISKFQTSVGGITIEDTVTTATIAGWIWPGKVIYISSSKPYESEEDVDFVEKAVHQWWDSIRESIYDGNK